MVLYQNHHNEGDKQMKKLNGKYFTIRLTDDETNAVEIIQEGLSQVGMEQPLTAIIRKIMSIGSNNIDWDNLQTNPMSLWSLS